MIKLISIIKNNSSEEFNSIPDLKITELIQDNECNTLKDVLNKYIIFINYNFLTKQDQNIIESLSSNKELLWYKTLKYYIPYISILIMFIYPLTIFNLWTYFGLIFIPISIFACSILNTPIKTLFYIINIFSLLTLIILGDYNFIIMQILGMLIYYGLQTSKIYYKNIVLRTATENEIVFKFLYVYRMIELKKI